MRKHKRKGFNKYEVRGDITIFFIKRQNGEVFEVLIDTEDLERLKKLNSSWHVAWSSSINDYYISRTEYLGCTDTKSNNKTNYLHRYITSATENEVVDHENHNSRDNRKENLRVTSNENNTKHKKGKNKNNTSGYRNVSKVGKWYLVQMQIDGKNTLLKKFPLDKVDEAGYYAELMREKYYGKFQGIS